MKKNAGKHLSIPFLILVFMLAGGDGISLGQATKKEVRFIIPIEAEKFSEEKPIFVRVWTAEEYEIRREMTRKCPGVHYNEQTKKLEERCPEGIEYQKVTPELFNIPVKEIAATIEVKSKKIKVGEGYRLEITGVRKNKLHILGAIVEDTARSETITLENLTWKYLPRAGY